MVLFRWSSSERRYLETIPLVTAPSRMVYSAANNALYLGYLERKVTKVPLDDSAPREEAFVTTPKPVGGMGIAGEFVYVSYDEDAYLFDQTGNLVTTFDGNVSDDIAWDESRRRMYVVDYGLLWHQIDEAGVRVDGGSLYPDSEPLELPMFLAPDGTLMLLGSGAVFNVEDLIFVNTLANDVTHAQWRPTSLITLRDWDDGTQIQTWDTETYGLGQTHLFRGKPLGLYAISDGLLVITGTGDGPEFFYGNEAFEGFPETPIAGIDFFTTSENFIEEGEKATLSWSTKGATEVFLNGQRVSSSGELEVSPTYDTTYQLLVKGPGGGAVVEVPVNVGPPTLVYGLKPPMFLNAKNFWLDDMGDLHMLFPDPNTDGASLDPASKPEVYGITLRQYCNAYVSDFVSLEEGEAWPKLMVVPAENLPRGDFQIAVFRSNLGTGYQTRENSSDLVVVHGPTTSPDASEPSADYAAYQRWLLHAPKQAGGFGATIKVENLAPDTDSNLQLVGFDSTGNMLGAEPITTGGGQTVYHVLYGDDGLFADLLDQISHIGVHDPAGNTRVSLRYTATASQFSAWTEEVDLREATVLGDLLEMEGRTNETSADGVAVLNLRSDESVQVWLVYRDRDTGTAIDEVALGTVAPGGKLLAVASDQFTFLAGAKYTIETRDPQARVAVLGLVFAGGDFFTATPVHKK